MSNPKNPHDPLESLKPIIEAMRYAAANGGKWQLEWSAKRIEEEWKNGRPPESVVTITIKNYDQSQESARQRGTS